MRPIRTKEYKKRAIDMYAMYTDQGKTFQEIATHYGITKQRVAQVFNAMGFETKRRTKHNGLDLEAIYLCHESGRTITEISNIYGISRAYLTDLLREYGFTTWYKGRGYSWSPSRLAALKTDYDNGMTQQELAAKYGVGQANISAVMNRYGLERRSQSDAVRLAKQRKKQAQS